MTAIRDRAAVHVFGYHLDHLSNLTALSFLPSERQYRHLNLFLSQRSRLFHGGECRPVDAKRTEHTLAPGEGAQILVYGRWVDRARCRMPLVKPGKEGAF